MPPWRRSSIGPPRRCHGAAGAAVQGAGGARSTSSCAAASSTPTGPPLLALSRRRLRPRHRRIDARRAAHQVLLAPSEESSFRATLRPLAEPPRPPGQPPLPPRSRPSPAVDLGRDPGGAGPRLRQPRPVLRNRLICTLRLIVGRSPASIQASRASPDHRARERFWGAEMGRGMSRPSVPMLDQGGGDGHVRAGCNGGRAPQALVPASLRPGPAAPSHSASCSASLIRRSASR